MIKNVDFIEFFNNIKICDKNITINNKFNKIALKNNNYPPKMIINTVLIIKTNNNKGKYNEKYN